MDVRVDNFLDFCKIFYPSRYRLEMKKPGFDFSLLEAEVRENGGIDVNNIFFNGFCVEETDKLDFDNFDIEKQLAKLDNDLDKAKYLTDCLYIIFSLPPLPFLPEKDLSVTPYYTIDEIFYAFKDNKIFGINVFEAIIFVYNEFDKNTNDNAPFIKYLIETKLINFVNGFHGFKNIESGNQNTLMELIKYQFFNDILYFCLKIPFFDYLIERDYQSNRIVLSNKENNEKKNFLYHFNKLNYELFKKNKFYRNYDFFVKNINYQYNDFDYDTLTKIIFTINFKTINNSSEYTLNMPILNKDIQSKTLYFPMSLASNINEKINLKSYNKSEKIDSVQDFYLNNFKTKNETLTSEYSKNSNITQLNKSLYEVFTLSFSKSVEEGYLNVSFDFYPMYSYFLLNKEDLIDKDINNFGPRYANKIRKYLVKNSNNSIANPISDEDAGIPDISFT